MAYVVRKCRMASWSFVERAKEHADSDGGDSGFAKRAFSALDHVIFERSCVDASASPALGDVHAQRFVDEASSRVNGTSS